MEEDIALKTQAYNQEAADIFPALEEYQKAHNITNLKKLCVQLSDFCKAIYASTKSAEERDVYKKMLKKLIEPLK